MKEGYDKNDFSEALIGAISVLLFMFVVKTISGPIMNFKIGIIITLLWLYLIYYGVKRLGFTEEYAITHTIIDFIICLGVASMFAIIFGQATLSSLIGPQIFGDIIVVLSWSALPVALSFDLNDCKSISRTKYISKI